MQTVRTADLNLPLSLSNSDPSAQQRLQSAVSSAQEKTVYFQCSTAWLTGSQALEHGCCMLEELHKGTRLLHGRFRITTPASSTYWLNAAQLEQTSLSKLQGQHFRLVTACICDPPSFIESGSGKTLTPALCMSGHHLLGTLPLQQWSARLPGVEAPFEL